jgi:hypothetical protein
VLPFVRIVRQRTALIYGDRVMMVLAEVVAIHTVAKIVIYPCNPRVSLKIFNNEKRGRMRFAGGESGLQISSYDINTFVIDINNRVISIGIQ